MRKCLILLGVIVSTVLCYVVVSNGLNLGSNVSIASFEEVEQANMQLNTLISQLVNINNTQFHDKEAALNRAIKEYQSTKKEYEDLKASLESADVGTPELSAVDIYDIGFLWTIIGSYGTEEGINLKMDVVKTAVPLEVSSEVYTMCDLKFTVSGDYIHITEFIYHLEDDDRLNFEISNFEMAKGGDNLQATFTVKAVPVKNENLSYLETSLSPLVTNTTNTSTNTNETSSTNTNTTTNTTTTNTTTTNTTSTTNTNS